MNASFSIIEKIKSSFLQSIVNKSDFHVAFTPFAFTMSNDDFYFLKTSVTTGAEAGKYLSEQCEFAIIANSVLTKPNVWQVDGDNLLYDAYKDILNTAQTIDPDVLTTDEQSKLKKAKSVLFTSAGNDSKKYKAYKDYAAKVTEAEKKLIDHSALRTSIAETDSAALAKWTLDFQTLGNQKKELLIEWNTKGAKTAIESAKKTYDDVILGKASFIEKWNDARDFKLGISNTMTSKDGIDFLLTTCIPNSISEPGAPIWKKISLSKVEIVQLTEAFSKDVSAEVQSEFGELQPDLDAITFEYCMVDILRPWFDEDVINNRMWKYPDESILSTSDGTMAGKVPAYPVKIILAKNIELVFTPNSPVNDGIKTKLKEGNRLFFGTLLLKTIPTNLADDKITSFRIQQLTNPELATLTKVAVQSAATPPAISSGNRIDMISLLNRQPSMAFRRNLEARSVPATNTGAPVRTIEAKPLPPTNIAGTVAPVWAINPAPLRAVNVDADVLRMARLQPILTSRPLQPATPAPPIIPPAAAPVPNPTVTISGKVLSTSNGPVPIAEIQIMNTGTACTQSVLTLDDGTYAIRDIGSSIYQIKVRKTGYVTQERVIDARANSTQDFLLDVQSVPTETFQVIGVICKKLPKLPDPWPDRSYI